MNCSVQTTNNPSVALRENALETVALMLAGSAEPDVGVIVINNHQRKNGQRPLSSPISI